MLAKDSTHPINKANIYKSILKYRKTVYEKRCKLTISLAHLTINENSNNSFNTTENADCIILQ